MISGNRFSLYDPFISTRKKATRVDNNKINPMILINESNELYLPRVSIVPHIRNKPKWFHSPILVVWNKFCKKPAVTAPTAEAVS